MVRTYEEWWKTVPEDLRKKSRKGDEQNKPLLNQVNYVLLHLHLAGKHDAKPSHAELKDWLHSGQVDVLRMAPKSKTTISSLFPLLFKHIAILVIFIVICFEV